MILGMIPSPGDKRVSGIGRESFQRDQPFFFPFNFFLRTGEHLNQIFTRLLLQHFACRCHIISRWFACLLSYFLSLAFF